MFDNDELNILSILLSEINKLENVNWHKITNQL